MVFGLPDSAVLGVVGVVIGAVLQHVGALANLHRQQAAQDRRLQSQERIRFKVESLVELFQQLDTTHRILNDNSNTASNSPSSISQQDFMNDIKPAVDEYRDVMRKNQIYLTDDQYNDMEEALGRFRESLNFIQWKIQNPGRNPPNHRQMPWIGFMDAYEEATETLREEINAPIEDD
ncbi:hypothetical protein [Halomicrobium urmianum]|uniref:hypothetical protein n=1 Tax=Halomicrobium urmianum TaxID=1586233 RepID=UPI001CD9CA78|nr:hypothetical protein [Halomicrobium urmianum]